MDHATKRLILTGGRDLSRATGIEIGARDAPLVLQSHGPVRYADYADTTTLRASLPDASIDPAALVEVDFVTHGGRLAPLLEKPVDYLVASHVLEHVPDLIGWLQDAWECLAANGTLGLAVPDKRFTFDRYRSESTIAEAVEAWLDGFVRPSLRQIYDSCWLATEISVADAWRIPPSDTPDTAAARLRPALDLVTDVKRAARYNDAHCWVFTPLGFLDLLAQMARLGVLPFRLVEFYPTVPGGYEFLAVFERSEDSQSPDVAASLADARARTQRSPGEQTWRALAAHPETARVATLEAEVECLRRDLDIMRRSTMWRATAPLRAVINRFRR